MGRDNIDHNVSVKVIHSETGQSVKCSLKGLVWSWVASMCGNNSSFSHWKQLRENYHNICPVFAYTKLYELSESQMAIYVHDWTKCQNV